MGIAFEGDLGHRIDAVLVVALLNGLIAKAEARSIALCISRRSIKTAQLADVLAGFYTPRPAGGTAMIGMPEQGAEDEAAPLTATLSKTAPDGTPAHTSNIARVLDTADNAVLIRNMLLAQNDQNATVVLAGPATGLVRLLDLYGAKPQIETKVSQLVVALGAFPSGADPAVKADAAAIRRLFAEWPTPIVAVGTEVGAALPYPAASIEADFAWAPVHPVVDAYRVFKTMPYDAPASALAAALFAAHPGDGYFGISEPGTITVGDDGRTTFTAGPEGRHRHLIADPAQKDRVIKTYRDLVSARPAPRPGRGGRGVPPAVQQQQQQQQQQAPPPRPPADVKPPAP